MTDKGNTRREFVTEVLEESQWPNVLTAVIAMIRTTGSISVNVEFGFLLDRELRGEKQMQGATVSLDALPSFFRCGFEEGAIEWGGGSDFTFSPVGIDLKFMLCNDADLHFYSADPILLWDVTRRLLSIGIKVYESGEPVLPLKES